MSALPEFPTDPAVRAAIDRLTAMEPGSMPVVSCYLKLEPRDKTRGKYLIKMKNRVRQVTAELGRRPWERAVRDAVEADLARVLEFFEEPARLPAARGVAVFACAARGVFDVLPLPQVHRSRLAVAPAPLIRELAALEDEFGTILVVACDRRGARFFAVTAYDVVELDGLAAANTRPSKFHGSRQLSTRGGTPGGNAGEHNFHQRIQVEKQRLYAEAAARAFRVHTQRPLAGLVVAGVGVDAGALVPHLHTYLHDLVLGIVKLNPKQASAAEVREAALALREDRERAWERAHVAAVRDGVETGWAVNGVEPVLKALRRGQVRTLLADGQDEDLTIDDAVEEALAQGAQVDVVYDDRARRGVDGLAALLRFRR